jgi:hypothetical protein
MVRECQFVCGEDEANIEGNVYKYTAVPKQINRICKLFLSTTLNTTGVKHNTTVSVKTDSLTIFVPSTLYLIS